MNFKTVLVLLFLIIHIDAFAVEDDGELSLAEQMMQSEKEQVSTDDGRGFVINGFFNSVILGNRIIDQNIVLNTDFKWTLPLGLDWLYKIVPGIHDNFDILYSKTKYDNDSYPIYIYHQYSFYLLLDIDNDQPIILNIGKIDPFSLNDPSTYNYYNKYKNLLFNSHFNKFKSLPLTSIKNIFYNTKYNNEISYPSTVNLNGNLSLNNKNLIIDISYISDLYNKPFINDNINNSQVNYYEYGFIANLGIEIPLKNKDKLTFNIGYEYLPAPKTIMDFSNNKINIFKSDYAVDTRSFLLSTIYEISKNNWNYKYKLSYYYTPSFNDMDDSSANKDINISAKKIQYLNLDLSIKNNDIALLFSSFFSDQKYIYEEDLHTNNVINRFFSSSINMEIFLHENDKYTIIPYLGMTYFDGFENGKLNKSFQKNRENGLVFNTGIKITF